MTFFSVPTAAQLWRVLVIDDSPDDRAEVRRLLLNGSERRYKLAEAETGAAGVRAVLDAAELPDCVVLDYNLPDMDAVEVLAALAGPDGLTACPVVVLTGTVAHEHTRAVIRAGAQDYLGKGWITAESLTRAVENAAERWAMAHQLREQKAELKASAERLQLVVEVAGLGVLSIDYAAGTSTPDATAAAMFGLEPGVPVLRAAIHDRFHPDDQQEVLRLMEQSLDPTGDGTFVMDHRVVRPDGSTTWLSVKKQIVFGNVAGVRRPVSGVLAAVDITQGKQAEQARLESERNYRALAAASSEVAYRMSADWSMMLPLDGRQLVATSDQPLAEWAWLDLNLPRDEHARVRQAIGEAIARKTLFELEHRVRRPDGSIGWTHSRAVPILDENEEVIAWFGAASDITDRKRVEQALSVNEERLRMALAASQAGAWAWELSTGVINWSPENYLLYGYDPTASSPPAYAHWEDRIHPDDREQANAAVADALAGRTPEFRHEFRIAHPVRGERWLLGLGQVEFSPAGEALRVVGINLDVTDRVAAEAALRDSEARLSGILRQSPVGIVQTNAVGCMTLVNPRWCEMLGCSEAELLGRNIVEVTHAPFVAPTAAEVSRLAAGGPDFQIEKAYCRKDGSVLRAQSNIAAIRSPNGEFLGLVWAVLDISERLRSEEESRRLAAELSEANRRKDVFLATLAHELRNPLAPLRNGLQVMKQLPKDNSAAVERVHAMMDRQVSLLVRLVDDLLDVSRITQGKIDLRKERVELRTVIDAAVETSRPVIEQAGHELDVVIPDEPIFVDGDATRLAQVVSNLLNNSAKYTHRGGRIRLTAGREDGIAVVSVKDNGIGIPPTMLDKVFVMFTQVDRTLEKTTGGLGIGLSLVKGLMEMHGGTIVAHSDGEGMGSEFVVSLPNVTPIIAEPERPDGQTSEVKASDLRRILVVDDNVDAADSLGLLLKIFGNEVRTAHDGEAGIEVAAQFRPDVVLMDIGMPKLNGYEAARRIRQYPWGRDMVLVALTGWGQEEDRKKSAAAGFDHHLVKPVKMDALTKLMAGLKRA